MVFDHTSINIVIIELIKQNNIEVYIKTDSLLFFIKKSNGESNNVYYYYLKAGVSLVL